MNETLQMERELLGTMMVYPECCDTALLSCRSTDFLDEAHAVIFESIASVFDGSRVMGSQFVDYVKNTSPETGKGTLGKDTAAYLARCVEASGVPGTIGWLCSQVLKRATQRNLVRSAGQIKAISEDDSLKDSGEMVAAAQAELEFLESQTIRPDDTCKSMEVLVSEARDYWKLENADVEPIKTGLSGLDEVIVGFGKQQLIVLAARPGHGKTALAGNIITNMARNGKRVLFWSIEMGSEEITKRLACTIAKVNSKRYDSRDLYTGERVEIEKAYDELERLPISIDDSEFPSIQEMLARSRCYSRRHGLDAVFVDYLTLVRPPDRKAQRYEQVGSIARGLKRIAKSLDAPVIALAQLNREADKTSTEPRLSNLRESGDIEQAADKVIMIHQKMNPSDMRPNFADDAIEAELMVEKNRGGACGKVAVSWLPQITQFQDLKIEQHENYSADLGNWNK